MNFLTKKEKTPLQFTLLFIIALPIAYAIYFSFAREYGMFLMMLSSNLVATIFDMHVVNSGSYLEDVKLVSNIGLQNSITHEIAHAILPLPKVIVDKVMVVITNTTMILALTLLFVRSLKVLAIVSIVTILVHIVSVSSILVYFMFEASPQSQILTHYLQALGVTQNIIDISYFFSSLSFYYLKYFIPFALAYYVWEAHGYGFIETKKESNFSGLRSMKLSYIFKEV